jgi:hypothetical protein
MVSPCLTNAKPMDTKKIPTATMEQKKIGKPCKRWKDEVGDV